MKSGGVWCAGGWYPALEGEFGGCNVFRYPVLFRYTVQYVTLGRGVAARGLWFRVFWNWVSAEGRSISKKILGLSVGHSPLQWLFFIAVLVHRGAPPPIVAVKFKSPRRI